MNQLPPSQLAAVVIGAAAVMFAMGIAGIRSGYVRGQLRRMYVDARGPIFMRNAAGHIFLWAAAMAVFGSLLLLPRGLAMWLSLPVLGFATAIFVSAYRAPAPFLPRWLRDEIDNGTTPVARPDRWDWLLFWIATPVMVLAILGVLAYIVFYGGNQAGR